MYSSKLSECSNLYLRPMKDMMIIGIQLRALTLNKQMQLRFLSSNAVEFIHLTDITNSRLEDRSHAESRYI